jgi:hypothetical protein
MIWRYMIAWVPMTFIGILNGILRQYGYSRFVGDLTAHQISTLTGIVFMGLYVWWLTGVWKIGSSGQALAIGLMWLGMTMIFEFVFGHFVMGHPWKKLFHDYNLLKGRVWSLVLIWITVAPFVFYKIRSK